MMGLTEAQRILKQIYGIEFPDSFFAFWDFTQNVPPDTFCGIGDGILHMLMGEAFNIFGPNFDREKYNPLRNSRYYNDPPEFLTLLYGVTDGEHWGLYLENPIEPAWFVASYYSNDAFELRLYEDLFAATRMEIEYAVRDYTDYLTSDSGSAASYHMRLEKLAVVREHLLRYAGKDRPEQGDDYTDKYLSVRPIATATRDRVGIAVPPALYRPLPGFDKFTIWNYQPTDEEVEAYERDALQALADGYPGTALKLGKDLWVYFEHFATTFRLLDAAYEALGWTVLRDLLRKAKSYREWYDANSKPR